MPTRRANLQGVSPDSFSSARYRCLSDSMNLLRMVPTCQLGRPGARWGWRSAYEAVAEQLRDQQIEGSRENGREVAAGIGVAQ